LKKRDRCFYRGAQKLNKRHEEESRCKNTNQEFKGSD